MTMTNIGLESDFVERVDKTKATGETRFFYIDNLRILLTVLVILTHLAIGYGAPGDWYYNEMGDISDLSFIVMTLLVVVNQAFFMGFFFFLSSYFSPGSLDRKGTSSYLSDRFRRLGIPLLFFALVISPLLGYGQQIYTSGYQGSFRQSIGEAGLNSIGIGPMWFVETLLVLSIIYALGRRFLSSSTFGINERIGAPGSFTLAIFALVVGMVTFIIRIWAPVGYWHEPLHLQLAHFPHYITLFVMGIVAYRTNWLAKIPDFQGKLCFSVVLFLTLILFPIIFVVGGGLDGDLTPFLGGLHWQSLVYAVWEQFLALGIIVTLVVWFRNRFNRQGKMAREMSGAAYAVYILHTPLIILLAVMLGQFKLDLGVKFVLVAPVAVFICFAAGNLAKKLPFAKGIL